MIIWLNRILFLRLIQANLQRFAPEDANLAFLNIAKIPNFRRLNALFFEVLAKDFDARKEHKDDLGDLAHLPYLNSSLFTKQPIEADFFTIEVLDESKKMPLMPGSALKNHAKNGENLGLLEYLFLFLDCFDYARDTKGGDKNGDESDKRGDESTPKSAANPTKALIKSSVLGLVFERLNAYSEGSFYTPSEITEFMARDALERVVVERFNAKNPHWNALNLENIGEEIDKEIRKNRANAEKIKQKYREILERIKICDPSVGSGHFLVAALNEMARIYYALGLADSAILGAKLAVEDDEILLINRDETPFSYRRPKSSESPAHALQKAMFELKKSIIENNLFGVDINPNSCNIARLRLWIELLKSAYYTDFSDTSAHHLQTLPNIDINVKCGNSLISRFSLKDSLAHIINIKKQIENYKKLVENYKNADRLTTTTKNDIAAQIENLKKIFVLSLKDEKGKKKLEKALSDHITLYGRFALDDEAIFDGLEMQRQGLFGQPKLSEEEELAAWASSGVINGLRKKLDEVKSGAEYKDAFEWRFEFPEVLDENGDFVGFDLVLGNPPYIRQEKLTAQKPLFKQIYKVYEGKADFFTYFFERGFGLLKDGGILSFIVSNKWTRAGYGAPLRQFLLENTTLLSYTDFNGVKIFANAAVDTGIIALKKAKAPANHALLYTKPEIANIAAAAPVRIRQDSPSLTAQSFTFGDSLAQAIKAKIEAAGTPLAQWGVNINYGIKTGYNDAFIIDTKKREEILAACGSEAERERTAALIKPMLRGRDIKRYGYRWAGLWVILAKFDSHKYLESDYPAIYKHLLPHKERLQARGQCRYARGGKADTGKGYAGQHHWLELDNNPKDSYLEEFAKPKVVYSEIVREPQFYLDNGEFRFGHFYAEATSFIMSANEGFEDSLKYLLGVLQSKIGEFAFRQFYAGGGLGSETFRYKKKFLERLPIPPLSAAQGSEISAIVGEIIAAKKAGSDTAELESRLDSLVFALYGLNAEEIALVNEAIRGGGH